MPVRKYQFKGTLGTIYAILVTVISRCVFMNLVTLNNDTKKKFFHVFCFAAGAHLDSFCCTGHIFSVTELRHLEI